MKHHPVELMFNARSRELVTGTHKRTDGKTNEGLRILRALIAWSDCAQLSTKFALIATVKACKYAATHFTTVYRLVWPMPSRPLHPCTSINVPGHPTFSAQHVPIDGRPTALWHGEERRGDGITTTTSSIVNRFYIMLKNYFLKIRLAVISTKDSKRTRSSYNYYNLAPNCTPTSFQSWQEETT